MAAGPCFRSRLKEAAISLQSDSTILIKEKEHEGHNGTRFRLDGICNFSCSRKLVVGRVAHPNVVLFDVRVGKLIVS
jgi:hypothetical protein